MCLSDQLEVLRIDLARAADAVQSLATDASPTI
jgi:hypothetical protein